MNIKHLALAAAITSISLFDAHAASKTIKAKAPSGYQLLVFADSNSSALRSTSSGSVSVKLAAGKKGRLYLVNSTTGALGANVVLAI